MNLEKYKNNLIQNIKQKLSEWLECDETAIITNEEVYRFLHSIKGTAGTLQLGGLMIVAQRLLEAIEENHDVIWTQESLREFLFDLIEHTYEYEHFTEAEMKGKWPHRSEAPLIQIIDDDVSMLILLKDILEEKGCIVLTNTDPEKATKQYFEMQPDCLIIDIQLPFKNGFQILEDINLHNEKYFIPKIMISIQNDKASRIKAYKMGADDFICKPIEIDEFIVKIERHLQRKKIFDQSVLIDELTQVYNRRYLEDFLTRCFQEYKRNEQPFAIAILDIDFFKKINDTYGHAYGDYVLIEFSQYIKTHIRSSDIISRFGGEEFVVIFPRIHYAEVTEKLRNLIYGFADRVFTHKGQSFSVTFSAGVYVVDNPNVTREEALKHADAALYEAKRLGRSRVECCLNTISNKQKLNITVIDDDIIIRSILTQTLPMLDIKNYELDIAVYEDGPSFLASSRVGENVTHFLILDGIMPTMDGIEVLKKVKSLRNADQYKVLMLTGRKSEEDIKQALKLGADDYVTKPFNISELHVRIKRLLTSLN